MFRVAFKSALARKGRLVLTSLAVIAGCAFLSGVFVFSDTIKGSFDRLFADAYEDTDAFVRSSNVIEGDFGSESRDRRLLKLPTFRGQFQTGTMALGGLCHGTQGTQAPYPGVQA